MYMYVSRLGGEREREREMGWRMRDMGKVVSVNGCNMHTCTVHVHVHV